MIAGDTVHLAMRNLSQAKLRTSLTVLGVSIGIASLAGMVSLGVGLQEQFVDRFMRSGMFDSVTVLQAQDLPGFLAGGGRGGRGRSARRNPDVPRPLLDAAAVKKFEALPEVKEVYPNLRAVVELKYGDFDEPVPAAGVPMSARGEGTFQSLTAGRFFDDDSKDVCMLSLDLAKRIADADPRALVGRTVTLYWAGSSGPPDPTAAAAGVQISRQEAAFTVVGIVERESGPQAPGQGFAPLMIPLARAQQLSALDVSRAQLMLPQGRARQYGSVTVKVSRAQSTQDVEGRIKEMGFNAFSINDALAGAKRAFIILDIVLSLIGSIALAVSSLGIVNTMVMSILERTREIGIMKAIGGSDRDIRTIFLVEASAIGAMGGVAGVALGWTVGRIINFGANVYIRSQGGPTGNLFSLPFWLIAGAIAFALVVSLIAGSYPASRAAKLDPIQALRHD